MQCTPTIRVGCSDGCSNTRQCERLARREAQACTSSWLIEIYIFCYIYDEVINLWFNESAVMTEEIGNRWPYLKPERFCDGHDADEYVGE